MISAINANNNKVNFRGTTIIKKEDVLLDEKMDNAVNLSRPLGIHHTRLNGYTMVVVDSERFSEEEAKFLKGLRQKRIDYVNFTKTFDWKNLGFKGLTEMIEKVLKSGFL